MSVTNFELITLLAVLTAVRVLSQDLRGQSVMFNRPSVTSQQRASPRQQTFNQPMTRSQEFPMSSQVIQPNRQLGGNPQLRQSVSSSRDISRSRFLQTNNADQAQRSRRVLPQQTFRQQVLRQQELQQRKQQQEWLQRQRQQMENGVGSINTRRNLPQGQLFSNFQRLNRVSTQEQGQRQRPLLVSGSDSTRRGGVGLSRFPNRSGSLPQDPFLRLAVLNNRSPEEPRQLSRRPEQVAELEEQQRQLYYLRLREERLQRQENQRIQEARPRRPQTSMSRETEEKLRQQVLNKSQQQQFEQQQQQKQQQQQQQQQKQEQQQQPTTPLNLANLGKLTEKSEKDSLLAKREKIYNLIKLLGFQPIDLFNMVAALEAGKSSLDEAAVMEQPRKNASSNEPPLVSTDSQPPPMTTATTQMTNEPRLMTNEPIFVTNELSTVTGQPIEMTTQVIHLTSSLIPGTHNLTVTQAPRFVVSNSPLVTTEPVYSTNHLTYVTKDPTRGASQSQNVTITVDQVTSQPQIVTTAPDQVTSQPQIVTIAPDQITSQPQIVTTAPDQVTSQPQIVTIAPDQLTSQPQIVTVAADQVTSQPQIVTIPPDQATIRPTPITSQPINIITTEPSHARSEPVTVSHKPNAHETTNVPPPKNRYDVSIILGMSHADTTTASINKIAADVRDVAVRNSSFPDVAVPQATNGTLLTTLSTDPANLTVDSESLPVTGDRTRTEGGKAPGSLMYPHRNYTNETSNFEVRTGQNESTRNDLQNVQAPLAGSPQMVTNGGPPNDDLATASKMLLTELISLSQSTSNMNTVVNDKVLLSNIANIISSLMAGDPMYPLNTDTSPALNSTFMDPMYPLNTDTSPAVNSTFIDINMTAVGDMNNNDMIRGTNLAHIYGEINGTDANKVQIVESPIPTETHWFQQRGEMTSTGTVTNYTDSFPDNFFPESRNRFSVADGENSSPYSEQSQNGTAGADESLSMATAIARMYGIPIDEAMIMLNFSTVSTPGEQDTNLIKGFPSNATASVPFVSEYVPARYVQPDASHDTTPGNTSTTDAVLLPTSYSIHSLQDNTDLTTTATTSSMHSSQDNAYLTTPLYQVYGFEPAPPTWSPSRQEEGISLQPSPMNLTELATDTNNSTVPGASDSNVVLVWNSAVTNNNLLPSLTDAYNETLSSDNLLEANRHNPHNFGSSPAKDDHLHSPGAFPYANASTNVDKVMKPQTGSTNTQLDSLSLLTSFNQLAKDIASNVIQLGNSSILSSSANNSSLIPPASGLYSSDTFATSDQSTRLEDSTTYHSQANQQVSTTAANLIVK